MVLREARQIPHLADVAGGTFQVTIAKVSHCDYLQGW